MRKIMIKLLAGIICVSGQIDLLAADFRLIATASNEVVQHTTLGVNLTVKNIGDSNLSVIKFPDASNTEVEIKDLADGEVNYFGRVLINRIPERERNEPPAAIFDSGQTFTYALNLNCRWDHDRVRILFDRPGAFQLRFCAPVSLLVGTNRTFSRLVSEWITINVRQLSQSDAAKLERLTSHKNNGWIFSPQEAVMFRTEREQIEWREVLVDLIEAKPDSYWAAHAHMGLAFLEEHKASNIHNGEQKNKLIESARAHVDKAIGNVQFDGVVGAQHFREGLPQKQQ